MKIDRHNYEEFFILYMDNELSSEEKRQVEAFVEMHPDLKEELDVLLQYKMMPDTSISFEGKEELLRINGDTPVTLTNYEEWFTQYIDHELTPAQKEMVEAFIGQNPSLAKDLLLFQRATLQPETVIFKDKSSLYRKEDKRRAAPLRLWRLAAAAILVIGLGFATYSLLNRNNVTPAEEVAKTIESKTNIDQPVIKSKESTAPATGQLAVEDINEDKLPAKETIQPVETLENQVALENNPAVKNDVTTTQPANNVETAIAYTNNLEKPSHNPTFNTQLSKTELPTALNKQKELNPALTNRHVTTPLADPSDDIVTASNRDDGKKNKLRGFFRKVTRTFEKRTNIEAANDDDHLLVAGLSIKLR